MIVLVKLFLAHLIGDFILQPRAFVDAKEKRKLFAWQLYIHALIHGLLVIILLWDGTAKSFRIAFWITVTHLLIDAFKVGIQKPATKRFWFLIDQLAHFLSIYLIWLCFEGKTFPTEILNDQNTILLLTAVILLTRPASFAIRFFISKWSPGLVGNELKSLENAGQYIGFMERLFVFGFIITNHWEAIGFLLAAKSIFRFGDLKEAKDRILTEYMLLGTLASFGIAILTGLVYMALIER